MSSNELGERRSGNMAEKIVALLLLIGFAVGIAGCNTVEGMGKDVKAGGQAIEKAADKNRTY
jgi:entericidin B